MEITKEKFEENNEALKEAIDGEITVKGAPAKNGKVKGHVICDVYQLTDANKKGLERKYTLEEGKLIQASYALHSNIHYKTTHKIYIISEAKNKSK